MESDWIWSGSFCQLLACRSGPKPEHGTCRWMSLVIYRRNPWLMTLWYFVLRKKECTVHTIELDETWNNSLLVENLAWKTSKMDFCSAWLKTLSKRQRVAVLHDCLYHWVSTSMQMHNSYTTLTENTVIAQTARSASLKTGSVHYAHSHTTLALLLNMELQYQRCFTEYCYWIKWRYKLDHNGTSLIKCVHNHCYLVWDVFHFTKGFLCHCGYWEQHFLLGLSLLHLLCSCLMLVWLWTEGAAHPILNRQ